MAVLSSPEQKEFEIQVIVSGAGPVGLFTALRLAQAGIRVKVFEKAPALDPSFRAVGYYGAPLQALVRAKVFDKAVEAGYVPNGLFWRKPLADDGKGGKRYGDVIAHIYYPPGDVNSSTHGIESITLPQSKLTKILLQEGLDTGLVSVHWNSELIAINNHENFVEATFKHHDIGKDETYRASFLVGADGARSATRKLLNIQFRGHSWPERLLTSDIMFETPESEDLTAPTCFVVDPVHYGLITVTEKPEPGKKSLYRCANAIHPDDPRTDDELITQESVDEMLDRMMPGTRPQKIEIVRAAVYRIHQLCASTFRRGRCVLAGDAAHLNNPFGAMGLTTGILDGDAVADTLDLIINENKPIDLLSTYSNERQKVYQYFVNPVSTANKLRCQIDPELADDDWLIQLLQTDPSRMKEHGIHFFETWKTDMRKLACAI